MYRLWLHAKRLSGISLVSKGFRDSFSIGKQDRVLQWERLEDWLTSMRSAEIASYIVTSSLRIFCWMLNTIQKWLISVSQSSWDETSAGFWRQWEEPEATLHKNGFQAKPSHRSRCFQLWDGASRDYIRKEKQRPVKRGDRPLFSLSICPHSEQQPWCCHLAR